MGKQTKRNRKKGKSKTLKNENPQSPITSSNTNDNNNNTPPIHSRLRHADPKIRSATLSGLCNTLFHPSSLHANKIGVSANQGQHIINPQVKELLPLISQRILDDDNLVCISAMECVNNFIEFCGTLDTGGDVLVSDGLDVSLSLVVKLSRIGEELCASRSVHTCKVGWNCLQTLCGLIEGSDASVQLLSVCDPTRPYVVDVLTKMIRTAMEGLSEANKKDLKEEARTHLCEVMVFGCRALHSLADDNHVLVRHICEERGEPVLTLVEAILRGNAYPVKSRLHTAGFAISLRNTAAPGSTVWSLITESVIPLLHTYLQFQPDIANQLSQRVEEKFNLLQKEKEDVSLEKEADKGYHERRKAKKQAKADNKSMALESNAAPQKETVTTDAATDMEEEELNEEELEEEIKPKKEKLAHGNDAGDEYSKALLAWNNASMPLKLALEITTNLCSRRSTDKRDDDGDAVMEEDNTDDNENDNNALLLLEYTVSSHLPLKVMKLLLVLCQYNPPLTTAGSLLSPASTIVFQDMLELQSKCGTCLYNVGMYLQSATENSQREAAYPNATNCNTTTWQVLSNLLQAKPPTATATAITHGMLSYLHSLAEPNRLTLTEWDFMKDYIHNDKQADAASVFERDEEEQHLECQRNIISILSLSSTDDPTKLSETFLSILANGHNSNNTEEDTDNKTWIQNDILNAIMDVYSEDLSSLEDVFWKLNVLKGMEQCVNKWNYKLVRRELELEETVLNVERFGEYKRTHRGVC